jgi:hypothetical protein
MAALGGFVAGILVGALVMNAMHNTAGRLCIDGDHRFRRCYPGLPRQTLGWALNR